MHTILAALLALSAAHADGGGVDDPGKIVTMTDVIEALAIIGSEVQASDGTTLLGYSTTTPCGNAMPKGFVIAYDAGRNRMFAGPFPKGAELRVVIMDDNADGRFDRMQGDSRMPDVVYAAMRSCTVAAANAATP